MNWHMRLYYAVFIFLICQEMLSTSHILAVQLNSNTAIQNNLQNQTNTLTAEQQVILKNGLVTQNGNVLPTADKIADKSGNDKVDPTVAESNGNGNLNGKNGNGTDGNGKKDAKEKPVKTFLSYVSGDSDFRFWVRLRMPDFIYGKNLRFLNNDNPTDRIVLFRHTLDFNFEYHYGKASRDYEAAMVKMTIRNKGIWGDPESIALTTFSTVKETDVVFGDHRHAIPRHVIWVRELWMQICLSDLFCLPFCNYHTLTIGAFPFELGRGIALGAAYATDPSDLGFVPEAAVDQYAFGGKLSGEIFKDTLFYDLYGACLENKADTFDNVNAAVNGQEFGHLNDPARGFGVINYVVAARLKWMPSFESKFKARIEPYILYNHNPEQRIEFLGDAKSNLATCGLAGEFEISNWEFGFDTAFNFGHQFVKGWDRNHIIRENRDGTVVVVNKQVRQAPPGTEPNPDKSPLALKVSENQIIIDRSPQAQSQNGQIIGSNSLGTLINTKHRFTNPYFNKYKGFMFVYDMSYYFCKPDFKVSTTLGYASGDANPNKDEEFIGDSEVDGEYDGFISLQEVYSGIRVRSAFLLSGAGKIPRPLSFPSEDVLDPFTTSVGRFTNLVFVGGGFTWAPSNSCRKWSVNPNVLAYWEDFPPRFFSTKIENNLKRFANPFLGTELNVFVESLIIEDWKFFLIVAVFFPGGLYRDISGRPLTKAQANFLNSANVTGIRNERVPVVGQDTAFYINVGTEYKF